MEKYGTFNILSFFNHMILIYTCCIRSVRQSLMLFWFQIKASVYFRNPNLWRSEVRRGSFKSHGVSWRFCQIIDLTSATEEVKSTGITLIKSKVSS